VSLTSPVARLASRAAARRSRRPGGKIVTTVKTDTTVITGGVGLRTGVAVATVAGVMAGNRSWRVTGDVQNVAVTISQGGWSALTAKHRSAAELRTDRGALHHETDTKIVEGMIKNVELSEVEIGETAIATTSELAPGHATGKGGTTGGMPGGVMTGEVVAVVEVEGVGAAWNQDQGTGSAMNAILIISLGERNASNAERLNLVAGITANPIEVLQWTEGEEEEAGDSIAEMGIGTALNAIHTISLRG